MAASPTARSLEHCRRKELTAGVTERWNPHAGPHGVRQDLFGCIDLIVCVPGVGLLGVQATSASNVSARIAKAKAEPRLREWLLSKGGFEVWGWKKKASGRWELRRVALTLEDLDPVPVADAEEVW